MNNRAFNKGVTTAFALRTAGEAIARGAKSVGRGTASVARGTKDTTSSFWAGFKAGIKSDSVPVPPPSAEKPVAYEPRIIVVQRV